MHRQRWLSALVTLSLLAACAPAALPVSNASSTPTIVTSAVGAPPTPTIRPASTHTPGPTPVTMDCADAPFPSIEEPRPGESDSARWGRELRAWSVRGADIPGLGGFYMTSPGNDHSVTILMTDPTQQEVAEAAAKRIFGGERFVEFTEVNVLKADYPLHDLARWYACLRDILWAFNELDGTDIDERANRIDLDFRDRPGLHQDVESLLRRSGVPLDAVRITTRSCPGGPYQPPMPDRSDPAIAPLIGALQVTVAVPRQVRQGVPATFTMALKNVSKAPIHVEYGEANDYVVTRPDGDKVWNLRCQFAWILLPLYVVDLEPGQERTLTQGWQQVDNRGDPIAPGDYLIYGVLSVKGGWASPPARITVLPD